LWGLQMVSSTEGWAIGDMIMQYLNGKWSEAPLINTQE